MLGLGVLVASMLAQNRYHNFDMAESLLLASFCCSVARRPLAVPLPRGVDDAWRPTSRVPGAMVLLMVLAARGGPRERAEIASFTGGHGHRGDRGAVAYGYGWQYWVPAGAITFGMIVVTNAAKLTVAVARIALPPIPAPGETVSNDELLDPMSARTPPTRSPPTWQAIIASVPESAARLTERSRLAKQLLVGFLTAGALVLALGSITVVVQGHFFIHSLIVAGLVASYAPSGRGCTPSGGAPGRCWPRPW